MLKLKILIFMALTGGVLMLNSSGVAQTPPVKSSISSRVLRDARLRNKINWGLRTVSPPISFQNNYGQWQGFCTNLIDLLENYLKDNQLVKNDFRIERYAIPLEKRFLYTRFPEQPNEQLRLDGECGSDTTKQEPGGIKFSLPYFQTRTLLLIRKDKADKFSFLSQNFNFDNIQKPKVGVVKGSITGDRVKRYFDDSEVDIVKTKGGTSGAIDTLLKGEVDALAGNEIFLNEMLNTLNNTESKNKFYVDSKWIISRETYGLILPADDDEWVKIINEFLIKEQKNVQKLLETHITNQSIAKPSDLEISERKTSKKEWMFIFLIILGMLTVFGLTYTYWVRRQNLSSLTKSNVDTLDLYHNKGADPRAIAIAFKQLAEKHPNAELRIVGIEVEDEDKFLLRAKTTPDADKSELIAEYFSIYKKLIALAKQELKALILEKNSRISSLETMVKTALERPSFYSSTQIEQVGTMTSNPGGISQNMSGGQMDSGMQALQGNNNTQIHNQGDTTVSGDRIINMGDGNYNERIQGNYVQGNYYAALEKQSLAEAAAEIQKLLIQLEQSNPTATEAQKEAFVSVAIPPTKKERLINAFIEGGKGAIEEFLDNPYVNVAMKIIEGWRNA